MKKNTLTLTCAVLILAGCAKTQDRAANQLPASWYVTPAENTLPAAASADEPVEENPAGLAGSVNTLYDSAGDALDQLPSPPTEVAYAAPMLQHPKDWLPWHLAAFLTDFSVSIKGVLGPLVSKGTPGVIAIWRKQYPKAPEHAPELLPEMSSQSEPDLLIDSSSEPRDLQAQLEPAIRAAVASGEVADEPALRSNLLASAREFLAMTQVLENAPAGRHWWVSRMRLDLLADISGKVTPTLNVGGEARFRFEWHRIMKKKTVSRAMLAASSLAPAERKLADFISAMSEDLDSLSGEFGDYLDLGFAPASFRVGVGSSVEGNVGVVKAVGTLIGQIYFTADTPKPVVNPKPSPSADGAFDKERLQFRKGLLKAAKIGKFFARQAARPRQGSWKIHELRLGFDAALSGKVGLVTVSGLGTSEFNFYNQRF